MTRSVTRKFLICSLLMLALIPILFSTIPGFGAGCGDDNKPCGGGKPPASPKPGGKPGGNVVEKDPPEAFNVTSVTANTLNSVQ